MAGYGIDADVETENASLPRVLLFNGTGTISSDVSAVEAILKNLDLSYATANSSEMDSMSETKLKSYKLLIVRGGTPSRSEKTLSHTATTNIHNAVEAGLHCQEFARAVFLVVTRSITD